MADKKILVAYFSASGNTASLAKEAASAIGADLFEIKPEQPYTIEDLNWNNKLSRSSVEMNNPDSRPAIAENITQEQLDSYDAIFVGYPVWWYDAPRIIYSFMESLDFSDKTVICFATSGGSAISDGKLKAKINANFLDGLCISNFSAGEKSKNRINAWIEKLGILE